MVPKSQLLLSYLILQKPRTLEIDGKSISSVPLELYSVDLHLTLYCEDIVGPVSPSGHGVASIPIRVLYSHASPVGTAEDLSSQTTKSSSHRFSHV